MDSALVTYLDLFKFAAFFTGWAVAMLTGLMFAKAA